MSHEAFELNIDVLDVSQCSYAERICAAALQGLANRAGPRLYLDYGTYDDPAARRTNEVFMSDEFWYGKYRDLVGAQDRRNLEYYRQEHSARIREAGNLDELIRKYAAELNGCVVWDAAVPDTVNLALMLAAQQNLLPVDETLLPRVSACGLEVRQDLRGCFGERVDLYRWALENLMPGCKPGWLGCIEPEWQRPEFVDFLVQNKVFIYNLSSREKGLGGDLLLLLAFGPAWLREVLFALRLDILVRRYALRWLGTHSPEVGLNIRIQQRARREAIQSDEFPTLFGWHTCRDDELSLMLLLSANGLRLAPAHLAGNFSFHNRVKPLDGVGPAPAVETRLDEQGVYLTFTLSDGDQLMMMSTAELGNWYSPARGRVCFNWETQPLLAELAPALLEKFQRSASVTDCLIAGPSGAGYVVPPLAPDLPGYLRETVRLCQAAGLRVATTYVADPPRRVLRQLARHGGGLDFLAGYAVIQRKPQTRIGDCVVIANEIPAVSQIWDAAEQTLANVRRLIEAPGPRPRFIGVHLFAYRTTIEDVARFAETLQDAHVHIVRADTFLSLAKGHLRR
ncbi:GxGYxY sequence motif in domain of unknown function [Longilinea arvoryzae]|uniref:Uncharacterized protein n=1 Tax=Longilinea arvoryzae TaxID=360412 RepID=A0A0S7BF06_9CHLR|nr:GxGYxYP domain-containing protein [Longilinea arvoryzae]GAP13030.1 GxGYxY sequence motif in domain of unknown function [Longilinea arvoryzae]